MVRSNINATLERYSNLYAEASRALTLEDRPMNIEACSRGNPTTAVSCLTQIQNVLNGVVRGTNQYGQVAMTLDANGPVHAVSFVCNGLSGCAADLDRLIRNRTRDITQVQTARTRYLADARRNITEFTNRMRTAAAPRIAIMRDRMNLIARAFGAAGVRGATLNMTPYDRTEVEYDENGVPQVPSDLMSLIAGGPNGAPHVDAATFSEISGQVADTRATVAEERDAIGARITELEGLGVTCPAERVTGLLATASERLENLTNLSCFREETVCDDGSPFHQVGALVNELATRSGSVGLDSDATTALASLHDGTNAVCPSATAQAAYNRNRDACTRATNDVNEFVIPTEPAEIEAATLRSNTLERTRARLCATSLVGEVPSESACASARTNYNRSITALERAIPSGTDSGDVSE